MLGTALRLVGIDLQHQLARLRAQAELYKNRALEEAKHKAINVGVMIALALFGLFFVLLTVVAALAALFLWVAAQHGAFVGIAVVGGTTAVLAAILFTIAAMRGKSASEPARPAYNSLSAAATHSGPAAAMASHPLPPNASFVDAFTHNLTTRTAHATNDALDTAAEVVRKSSPATIYATLAAAAAVGVLIGRQRR
jgi:hypothetical protein